jgi:putative transposase
MGLQAVYPKRKTTVPAEGHKVYPYLLRGLRVDHPNEVWCSDITYIPMTYGFMYLVAVMDWFSRYVISWEISNTMDVAFCLKALERALAYALPHIFNTDQGAQSRKRSSHRDRSATILFCDHSCLVGLDFNLDIGYIISKSDLEAFR